MPEVDRTRLAAVLDELCTAVGADGGAALYMGDSDGVLHVVAAASPPKAEPPSLMRMLRGRSTENEGRSLVLAVPGTENSIVVLARRGARDFTQQDGTLARLYVRRLSEAGAEMANQIGAAAGRARSRPSSASRRA